MTVYHWTTKENAEKIMIEGLRHWSFVCDNPDDWSDRVGSEVCLVIESLLLDTDEETWQGVTHERISPDRIKVFGDRRIKT